MVDKSDIENYANEFMQEEGLKGKAKRLKIIKIIETVGFNKKKIKISLLRSTINERIHHD
ncbi:MAG: hypothetical protein ACFFBP_06190 [Promethearchaeota archaeon]